VVVICCPTRYQLDHEDAPCYEDSTIPVDVVPHLKYVFFTKLCILILYLLKDNQYIFYMILEKIIGYLRK